MRKKTAVLLAAGFAGLLLIGAAFFLRPVNIEDQDQTRQVRRPVWTVGQALQAAGIHLDPADQVTPGIHRPIPLNRSVRIVRSAQVYVWEEGKVKYLTGLEKTAGELLEANNIVIQPGDRLLWDGRVITAEQVLPGGQPVVLKLERARKITIDDNGKAREVTSTSSTIGRTLWEAGIRVRPGDRLSAEAGALLSETSSVAYLAAVPVIIQLEGTEVHSQSTAATVGQALAEAGVSLQALDFSKPGEDQPLPADGRIQVVRVREEIALKEEIVPYGSSAAPDPDLELDQRRIMVAGQYGVKVTRERVRYEDGQEVNRLLDSDWIASQPVDETLGYGTKAVVKTLDVPGGPIEYWRAVQVYATSYSPCRLGLGDGRCGYTTASGQRLTKGIIAVRLSWYRMMAGQRVYVPGYGYAVIADVGGGIPGRYWIDLGFDEDNYQPIVGWTTLYFLTPVPANIPWALP